MLVYYFFLDLFAKHLKTNNKYPAILKADNIWKVCVIKLLNFAMVEVSLGGGLNVRVYVYWIK